MAFYYTRYTQAEQQSDLTPLRRGSPSLGSELKLDWEESPQRLPRVKAWPAVSIPAADFLISRFSSFQMSKQITAIVEWAWTMCCVARWTSGKELFSSGSRDPPSLCSESGSVTHRTLWAQSLWSPGELTALTLIGCHRSQTVRKQGSLWVQWLAFLCIILFLLPKLSWVPGS